MVDLGAGHVRGQQVGGKLDAAERRLHVLRQSFDRARLGQSRQSFDQQVAVCQQPDHQPLDHGRLSDDRLLHALLEGLDLFTRAQCLTPVRKDEPRASHSSCRSRSSRSRRPRPAPCPADRYGSRGRRPILFPHRYDEPTDRIEGLRLPQSIAASEDHHLSCRTLRLDGGRCAG